MPSSVESEIRSRLESLVQDLTAMIRASAMDLVSEALGDGYSRPRRIGERRVSTAAPTGRRSKGAKRDPDVLAALTAKLDTFIKKTPGQRIEQIGKALRVATKDLALPVKKLIAAKKISTRGQKRATTYYAAPRRRGAKAAPKRKAARAGTTGTRAPTRARVKKSTMPATPTSGAAATAE